MVWIIDASVAIKWFVAEEGQERALDVLEHVFCSPRSFAVPELFYFELCHVFNRVVPKPNGGQNEVLKAVFDLGISRFSMTMTLWQEARNFQWMGLSGYDAAYVALAKSLKGIWLSCDKKAHDKISHLGFSQLL